MAYFFCKLNPPRPTFAQDMTPAEMKLMQEHGAYGKTFSDRGMVIVFGPVADPRGAFGVAIVEANAEADVRAMAEEDPVVKANAGFHFEGSMMPRAILRPKTAAAEA